MRSQTIVEVDAQARILREQLPVDYPVGPAVLVERNRPVR